MHCSSFVNVNSRKRIKLVLDHRETDKIPIDFGATAVTGISASVVSKLRDYYGLSNDPPVKIIEPYQMIGEIADDLKEVMGIDCIIVWGTKEQIVNDTKEVIKNTAKSGGFMLSSSRSIHNFILPENYLLMLETARKYGRYSIDIE